MSRAAGSPAREPRSRLPKSAARKIHVSAASVTEAAPYSAVEEKAPLRGAPDCVPPVLCFAISHQAAPLGHPKNGVPNEQRGTPESRMRAPPARAGCARSFLASFGLRSPPTLFLPWGDGQFILSRYHRSHRTNDDDND